MSYQANVVSAKIYDRIQTTLYSKNATNRTSSTNFYITFENTYKNVRNIIFDSIVIPFSYYVFDSTNNILQLLMANGLTQYIRITPGNYVPSTLISELQTNLNTSANFGVTVTATSDILTIASVNAYSTVKVLQQNQLGFTSDTASAISVTAQAAISPLPTVIPASNITIEWNGSSRIIALTPGVYNTAAEVATMVQTVINTTITSGSGAFVVTNSMNTYKYTITNSSTFQIIINTASRLLGFSADQTQALTQISDKISDIAGPNYLGVKSTSIAKLRANKTIYDGVSDNDVIYFFTINTGPGNVIVDTNENNFAVRFLSAVSIDTIDIQILLPDNTILDNHNLDITIKLILEIE